jgi:hypothetical protein
VTREHDHWRADGPKPGCDFRKPQPTELPPPTRFKKKKIIMKMIYKVSLLITLLLAYL